MRRLRGGKDSIINIDILLLPEMIMPEIHYRRLNGGDGQGNENDAKGMLGDCRGWGNTA